MQVNFPCLAWTGHVLKSLLLDPFCMTALQVASVRMLPGRQWPLHIFISSCPFRRGELYKYTPICCCLRWAAIKKQYIHKSCGWIWLAYNNCARAEHTAGALGFTSWGPIPERCCSRSEVDVHMHGKQHGSPREKVSTVSSTLDLPSLSLPGLPKPKLLPSWVLKISQHLKWFQ